MKFKEKVELYNFAKRHLEEELENYNGNLKGMELEESYPLIYVVLEIMKFEEKLFGE